jgi:hypothetical protein
MADSDVHDRVLEGHFACGTGLLVYIECLARSYQTKADGRDLTISLPRHSKGFYLDPPAWSFADYRDKEAAAEMADDGFSWGTATGYRDEPDGTQSLEYARVSRLRFETTIGGSDRRASTMHARTPLPQLNAGGL